MSKSKSIDFITMGIVAVTIIAVTFMVSQAFGGRENSPKIAILDTQPLIEAAITNNGNNLPELRKNVELKAQMLADEGYIVLRSESVRNAPRELYVQIAK